MAELKIGTCSWKYDSWKNLVYPDKPKINHLAEYSKKYNSVEVDQWFWSLFEGYDPALPKRKDVLAYAASIPKDFKFTVKLPNSLTLTHYYTKKKSDPLKENPYFLSDDLVEKFLDSVSEIKPNLGPMMMQFEYLNKHKMKSLLHFLGHLQELTVNLPEEFQFAIETRNPNYLKKELFEFLHEYNLGFVFLEGYYMPPVREVYSAFKEHIKGFTIIRLHGPDRSGIEKISGGNWNQIYQPKDDDLPSIASIISELLDRDVDVYLNVNNHYEGSAPITIEKISNLLGV
ncbi:MAG: hypothetical protein SCALA702_07900 [Melioribacteraceae bacterium]|nr:MAG: hypothetical protein SCALA702_07900 [Melioribacteraceae bacterium]